MSHFKVLVCEHINRKFQLKFSKIIVNKNTMFGCKCNTYGYCKHSNQNSCHCKELNSNHIRCHGCIGLEINVNFQLKKYCVLLTNILKVSNLYDLISLDYFLVH